jgi:hypothetical protein
MGDPKNIFNDFMVSKDPTYTEKATFHALVQQDYIEYVELDNEIVRNNKFLFYKSGFKSPIDTIFRTEKTSFKRPYPSNKYRLEFSGSIDDITATRSFVKDEILKVIEEIAKRYNFEIYQNNYTYNTLGSMAVIDLTSSDRKVKAYIGVDPTGVAVAMNLSAYEKKNRSSIPDTTAYSLKTLCELIVRYIEEQRMQQSPTGGKTRKQKRRSRKMKKTRKH